VNDTIILEVLAQFVRVSLDKMTQNNKHIYDTTVFLHFFLFFSSFFSFFPFLLSYISLHHCRQWYLHGLYHTSLLISDQPSTPAPSPSSSLWYLFLALAHDLSVYHHRVLIGDIPSTLFSVSLTPDFSSATTPITGAVLFLRRSLLHHQVVRGFDRHHRYLSFICDMRFSGRCNSPSFTKQRMFVWAPKKKEEVEEGAWDSE